MLHAFDHWISLSHFFECYAESFSEPSSDVEMTVFMGGAEGIVVIGHCIVGCESEFFGDPLGNIEMAITTGMAENMIDIVYCTRDCEFEL